MDLEANNTLNTKYFSTKNTDCIALSTFQKSYRNQEDAYKLLLIPDSTIDTYRYLYANAYIARKAEESGIIAYYYGDNYEKLSNGYGQYSYEKEEIKTFLNIYEQTRLYYYKVLLNKAFINESFYPTYEKLFLLFVSIERFITSKIDTIKDIESMSFSDMTNFMESYGLKNLSDLVSDTKTGTFINKERYVRQLLHNYTTLLHEKGSRAVIDKLLTIFDYGSSDIDITKYMIYDDEFSKIDKTTESDTNKTKFTVTRNSNNRLKFVETKYFADDNNATKAIIDGITTTAKRYDDFLTESKDKYWLPSNSSERKNKLDEDDILLAGLNVSETKYLSLKVSENLANIYMNTRYLLAYMLDKQKKNLEFTNNNNKITVDGKEANLFDIYTAITFVFTALLKIYDVTYSTTNNNYYWINTEQIAKDYALYKNNEKIVNSNSDENIDIINKYLKTEILEKSNMPIFTLNPDTETQLISGANADSKILLLSFRNMIKGLTLFAVSDFSDNNAEAGSNLSDAVISEISGIEAGTITSKYPYITEYSLAFIHAYINGSLFDSNVNYTNEYYKLCEALFNRYFVCNKSGLFNDEELSVSNDSYLSEKFKEYEDDLENVFKITENTNNTAILFDINITGSNRSDKASVISSLLIELINAVNSVFDDDMQVSFALGEDEKRELAFMEATITYFISYTTQIRDSSYIRIFDSKTDAYLMSDNINDIELTSTDIDNVYYDEYFSIN